MVYLYSLPKQALCIITILLTEIEFILLKAHEKISLHFQNLLNHNHIKIVGYSRFKKHSAVILVIEENDALVLLKKIPLYDWFWSKSRTLRTTCRINKPIICDNYTCYLLEGKMQSIHSCQDAKTVNYPKALNRSLLSWQNELIKWQGEKSIHSLSKLVKMHRL